MSHYKRYPKYKDSSVEWLGDVPEYWGEERIFAHFTEVDVRGGEKAELLAVSQDHGVMPQKQYEKLLGRRLSAQEKGDYSKYKRIQAGDLVYNKMRMWQGAIGVAPCEGIVSPAYVTFRAKGDFSPKYWHHMFKGRSFLVEVNRNSQGICDDQNSCNYDDFRTIRVPVAPAVEQADIIRLLAPETTRIDALIKKKTRFIELLKEKRQALITQAVTKGLDRNVKMKNSGVEWLGEVPEHWDVKPLCRIASHNDDTLPENHSGDNDIDYIDISSVSLESGIASPVRMKFSSAPSRARRKACIGDVAISTVRTYLKAVAEIGESHAHCVFSTGFAILRGKEEVVEDGFLAWAALNELFIQAVESHSEGLSYPAINASSLVKLKMPMPPKEEQVRVTVALVGKTTHIDALIEKSAESIEILKERRSALITAAVTGQIDLRAAA